MSVTPTRGRRGQVLAPCQVAGAGSGSWSAPARAVVAELFAQRGAAFGDAAVHDGVARAGEAHDLGVAVAEAPEVERFALARLQRADGLQAGVLLDAVECVLLGIAAIGVAGLAEFPCV